MAFRQSTLRFPRAMAPPKPQPAATPHANALGNSKSEPGAMAVAPASVDVKVELAMAHDASAMPMVKLGQAVVVNGKSRERETSSELRHAGQRSVKHKCDLDLDTLECSVCALPLSPPVFQCQNGHTVCTPCCIKISERCPSCLQPTGKFIRCLIAEKILESLHVTCLNAAYGCKEMPKYTTSDDHVKNFCQYRPCPCPAPGCSHEGPKQTLPLHLAQEHLVRTVELKLIPHNSVCSEVNFKMEPSEGYVMVKAVNQGVQLLVHREEIASLGTIFFCTSFEDFTTLYNLRVMLHYGKDYIMANASAADLRRREIWKRDVLLYAMPDESGLSVTFDVGLCVFTMANICN